MQFGCTFQPGKWKLIPYRGRRTVRLWKDEVAMYKAFYTEFMSPSTQGQYSKELYSTQSMRQDWAVYIFLNSLLKADGWPCRINFLLKGMDAKDEWRGCRPMMIARDDLSLGNYTRGVSRERISFLDDKI